MPENTRYVFKVKYNTHFNDNIFLFLFVKCNKMQLSLNRRFLCRDISLTSKCTLVCCVYYFILFATLVSKLRLISHDNDDRRFPSNDNFSWRELAIIFTTVYVQNINTKKLKNLCIHNGFETRYIAYIPTHTSSSI